MIDKVIAWQVYPGRNMLKPQVERPTFEIELYLKLFITTSGGW